MKKLLLKLYYKMLEVRKLLTICSNKIISELSRLGVGNDLFNNTRSILRIICPSKNAYSKYSEILRIVKKQEKSKAVLIALGPTATVLAYDLTIAGYHAVDIGHIDIEYEWYLNKAKNHL